MFIIQRTEVHSSYWQHVRKRLLILIHDCAVFIFINVIVMLIFKLIFLKKWLVQLFIGSRCAASNFL
jgi:hypothetical protein